MPEAIITYMSQKAKVACDGNCGKAWGISMRPRVQLSKNVDDFAYLSDGELGIAPANPGTSEGPDVKPANVAEFPNKWCVRQCERCSMSSPGEWGNPLEIRSFEAVSYTHLTLPTIYSV